MILRDQLQLLKGKYVKVGSRMAFWYCEICDDNIEAIMDELSNKEYKRITSNLEATTNELNNFEEIWQQRLERNIKRLKGHFKAIIEKHVKKEIKNKLAELKEKKIKLSKDEKKELRASLTLEYTPKYENEYKKAQEERLTELIEITLPQKKEEHLKELTNRHKRYAKLVKAFKPYLERKVKEVYPSIVDENTVIVRVTGYEESKYWDREEYDRANVIKVGTKIRIIEMYGEPQYNGREGVIEFIDSLGQLHGTWGGLAVVYQKDKIEVIDNE